MILKELRVKIHPVLLKRYRMACVKNDLSVPKQTAELIRNFVQVREQEEKLMRNVS